MAIVCVITVFGFDSTIFRSILQTRDGQIELRNEKNEQPYSILFEYLVLFFFQKYQFTNQRDCKINSNTQDDGLSSTLQYVGKTICMSQVIQFEISLNT